MSRQSYNKPIIVLLGIICVCLAIGFLWSVSNYSNIIREKDSTIADLTNTDASNKTHLPLYEEITAIKDRITITITEPNFTNEVPECDFYELREEDSEDYFQTTVNYWVFQNGQETKGDIEAFVEIYNTPDRTDLFVVEVARNCWFELTVSLDDDSVVVFPTISENKLSMGYMTFEVTT